MTRNLYCQGDYIMKRMKCYEVTIITIDGDVHETYWAGTSRSDVKQDAEKQFESFDIGPVNVSVGKQM